MATRKQRRRREKGRRHEYEYVYVDDSGQEVEVDEPEPKPKEKPATSGQKPTGQKPAGQKAKTATDKSSGERKIEPPSWNKVGRRGLIFAPFILVFMYLIRSPGDSTVSVLIRAVAFSAAIVPLMYLTDSLTYRWYQKRLANRAAAAAGSPPKKK